MGWETEYSAWTLKHLVKPFGVRVDSLYGRDSCLTVRLPLTWRPVWQRIIQPMEKSALAKYVCLNIGILVTKL